MPASPNYVPARQSSYIRELSCLETFVHMFLIRAPVSEQLPLKAGSEGKVARENDEQQDPQAEDIGC